MNIEYFSYISLGSVSLVDLIRGSRAQPLCQFLRAIDKLELLRAFKKCRHLTLLTNYTQFY
jgi:hypothetical protein